jgi:hypothetical protein
MLDVDKVETMLGSYSADPKPRVTEVISDEFPSGMIARGLYTVTSKVIDLDGTVWLGASIYSTYIDMDNRCITRLRLEAQDFEGLVSLTSRRHNLCGCREHYVAPTCFPFCMPWLV